MKESENSGSDTRLTAAQETLRQLWEEHVRYEFATHSTEDTLATMVEDAYVNHIPVLTGGSWSGSTAEVLLRAVHSSDASGYGDDSHLANHWQRSTRGRNGVHVHPYHPYGLDAARALPLQESGWNFRWSPSFDSGRASWPMSISTGTRRPCWSNSGCSMPPPCPSPASKVRARPSIRACHRTR